MTNFMKRFALVLCLVALCVGFMGVTAFAAYDPVTATIPVEITLSGYLPETADTFRVELTPADATCPMPEGTVDGVYVMDMVGASAGNIEITFDQHGIYTYTAKQLPVENEDCYLDESTYKIVAQVINNEDYTGFDLVVVIYRNDEAEKPDVISFANRYAMPTEVQITAAKTMDKKAPKDGAFSFELVDETGAVLETVANDEFGAVSFLPISYYKSGIYTYTLREVKGTDKNIIYDATEYTAVVEVAKDENGDYTAELSYLKGEEAVEEVVFANKSKPIVPKTGDDADIMLWGGIMAAALIAIVVLLVAMKKKPAKA